MIKPISSSSFSKNANTPLSIPTEHYQSQLSPQNNKDLRRLVLDKQRNESCGRKSKFEEENKICNLQKQRNFNFDMMNSPKLHSSPNSLLIKNQQKQQLIKEILLSKEPIQLENKIHNDVLLEVMKKAIKNKEEISFVQHFLRNVSALQIDQDFILPQELDLSAKIYPFVSYSSFQKGETIYKSGEFSFNYYILLKGKIAQYNDTDQNLTQTFYPQKYGQADQTHTLKLANLGANSQKYNGSKKYKQNSHSLNGFNSQIQLNESQDQEQSVNDSDIIQIPNKIFEKMYGVGQSFGEIEIMTNQTRSSTMVCLEESHLLTISKEGYDQVFVRYKKSKISMRLDFFKQFSFFSNISDSRLLNLINSGKKVNYQNKQIIYQEGDPVGWIYFIISGEVSLSQMNEKRRINVQIQGQKTYFGYDEIVSDAKPQNVRKFRVVSNSNDLTLFQIQAQKLMKFLMHFKQYELFVADSITRLNFRQEIADKIISTSNIIHIESESKLQKMREYEMEIKRNALQKIKGEQQKEMIPSSRQIQLFKPITQLEQIVNAREEIFQTLNKQQKYKNQGSVDMMISPQLQNTNNTNENLQTLKNRKIRNIFGSQKEFIFDQSYYTTQDSHHGKNKSLLELQHQIENSSIDSVKKKPKAGYIDSQDNLQTHHSANSYLDKKIQIFQKVTEDSSLSKFNVTLPQRQQHILKQILSSKINHANLMKSQQKKSFDDFSNQYSPFQDASENIQSLRNIDNISGKDKLINYNSSRNIKTIKEEEVIRKMRRVKTHTNIKKYFDSNLNDQQESVVNNFNVQSIPAPLQIHTSHSSNYQELSSYDKLSPIKHIDQPLFPLKLQEDDQNLLRNQQLTSSIKKRISLDRIQTISDYRSKLKSQTNVQLLQRRPKESNSTLNTHSHIIFRSEKQINLNKTSNNYSVIKNLKGNNQTNQINEMQKDDLHPFNQSTIQQS